jgi:pyruvate/2-oxoglutarate dehydrogenase complex dihydrolipoamide dehydrogenase (E3) component
MPASAPESAPCDGDGDDRERFLRRVRPPGWQNPTPRAQYDLVVLGGGPAGLSAARAARTAGLTVALVERHWLGGNSLNAGSIPSKALIRTGRAFEALINSPQFGGPDGTEPTADLAAAMRRMRHIRTRIAEYCSVERLVNRGIDVFFGDARFSAERSISLESAELRFAKALIATGARPRVCDIPGLEEAGYLTSTTVFDIETLPRRLGIIGGGPLGCEMAQAFAYMGSHVIILQNEPKFLPREERDAAEILSLSLSRSGVDTRLNTQVMRARRQNGEKWIDAEFLGAKYSLSVDEILLSAGRTANTEQLNLSAAGIGCEPDGRIKVDDWFCTESRHVYAAGDVCMEHKFTNIAEASGGMAVLNAFALGENRISRMIVPWCTHCDPEIAHVGMNIWDAKRRSIPVKTFTVMMQDVERAITDGRDDGFVKIHVRDGTDEVLGATIVASRASEMINEVAVIMNAGMGLRQVAGILHTYPAQSDAIRLAAVAYVNAQRS